MLFAHTTWRLLAPRPSAPGDGAGDHGPWAGPTWSDLAGLRAAMSEDQRARIYKITVFVGAGAEAWRCATCGDFGALGGFEASDGW